MYWATPFHRHVVVTGLHLITVKSILAYGIGLYYYQWRIFEGNYVYVFVCG